MNSIIFKISVCAALILPAGRIMAADAEKTDSLSAAHGPVEETVDMGYYSLPSRAVTGAVSIVTGDVLSRTPDASLPKTLVGRLPGLITQESNNELSRGGISTEDMGMSWWVRGASTINGTTPMIILDGIVCPNTNYVYITPQEIESVTLLKDAAALSIYGLQGAGGAISIKTKRGAYGAPKVHVTFDQSFQQMTRKPEYINSAKYVAMRNQAGVNDGFGPYSQFSKTDTDKFTEGGSWFYPDNNWYDMFMRDITYMTRAGVSVQGGTQNVLYFANINYMHQSSPFKTVDEPDRKYNPEPANDWFNFRSNIDVNFNSYLSGFLRLAGNVKNEKTTGFSNAAIYNHIFNLPPTMYGPLTPNGQGYENGNQVVTHDDETYPVYGMLNRSGYIHNLHINVTAQAGLNLDLGFLTKGLSLSGSMAYQTSTLNQTATTQDFSRWVRTQEMSDFFFVQQGSATNTPLSYGKASTMDYNLNLFGQARYKRSFGDHLVDAMAYIFYQQQELQKSNMAYKQESMGVTATYGFRNRYFIKGDIGYAGSEQFHPDRRYMATPAISAAWIASDESFMRGLTWLDMLKLRASYGITANDQLGNVRFLYLDYLDVNGNEGLRGNPLLRAEKMKKQNYGVDLAVLKGLHVSFDWYKSICDNMLINSSGNIPIYQGVPLDQYPRTNDGRMESHGYEITANYAKTIGDWTFNIGGSFTYDKNKVINVGESPNAADYAYRYRTEGYTFGQCWGYLIDYSNGNGIFNFQEELDAKGLQYSFGSPRVGDFIYQDLNSDGIIDEKDKAPIGYSHIPQHTYTVSAGVNWRGLELNVLFQGVSKVSRTVSGVGVFENTYQGVFSDIHENAWTAERWNNGEPIDYPALSLNETTNHVPNEFFIWDASYFRLKNLELAYTLPTSISRKIRAEKIRIALSGQNLLTWDKMKSKYIDPEVGTMNAFQPYRVYNIGFQLTF